MTGTLRWFKSSYSSDSGGECLEIAFDWLKSSYSDSGGADCVEVAYETPHGPVADIRVRDSKNPTGPILTVSAGAWTTFLAVGVTPHPEKA